MINDLNKYINIAFKKIDCDNCVYLNETFPPLSKPTIKCPVKKAIEDNFHLIDQKPFCCCYRDRDNE